AGAGFEPATFGCEVDSPANSGRFWVVPDLEAQALRVSGLGRVGPSCMEFSSRGHTTMLAFPKILSSLLDTTPGHRMAAFSPHRLSAADIIEGGRGVP